MMQTSVAAYVGLDPRRDIRWEPHAREDKVRFYALRFHEVGMLKASPQKLIAQGTDWRFLHELKKEVKGVERIKGQTASGQLHPAQA